MSASNETTNAADSAAATSAMVVVDLGKQKRSRIKKLRKGSGPLMQRVQGMIDELRAGGTIAEDAQPVVIVVREKQEYPFPLIGLAR